MKSSKNPRTGLTSIIVASSVGTLIEWYDFFIFGSLATIISTEFFPSENPTAALLATLATFAAGLVVRPLGALIFGRMGDRLGRKHTFMVTLAIMGITTIGIGFVPGYKTIGFWAPAIVLLLRLIQGLALGGEYGGAAVYVAEHSPEKKKGFLTSWIQTTSGLAFILSVTVILLIKSLMPEEQWLRWGWRIPFIASFLLVGVSIYIRSKMSESPLFQEIKLKGKTSSNPIKETFTKRRNLKLVLVVFLGLTLGGGSIGWITFYAQNFLLKTAFLNFEQANSVIIIGILLGMPFFILFGWLSDKSGRKNILIGGMLLGAILFRPVFNQMYKTVQNDTISIESVLVPNIVNKTSGTAGINKSSQERISVDNGERIKTISTKGKWKLIFWIFVLQFIFTMAYGPLAAFLVDMFPVKIRYTSVSFPYHFGLGIFGGLAPYFATYLVEKAHLKGGENFYLSGLDYPIILCLVSVVIGLIYINNDAPGRMKINSAEIISFLRKHLGYVWILLAVWVGWYGISRLGIPALLSGKSEDLIFGIILTFLITPISVAGLFLFGIFSLQDEYRTE